MGHAQPLKSCAGGCTWHAFSPPMLSIGSSAAWGPSPRGAGRRLLLRTSTPVERLGWGALATKGHGAAGQGFKDTQL